MPRGLESKSAVLEALSRELRFPDYFGGNWDALEDCIRDLSWLPPGDVALLHDDLPLAGDQTALKTYLSILRGAVGKWAASAERALFVVFPADARAKVQALAASPL